MRELGRAGHGLTAVDGTASMGVGGAAAVMPGASEVCREGGAMDATTPAVPDRRGDFSVTDKSTQQHADEGNTIKKPEDWTTGDEPMTGAQRSYLKTLSEEAKEDFDDTLTKAEASRRIDELQQKTGRGITSRADSATKDEARRR